MTIKSFVPTVLLALAIGLGPTTTSASPSSCAGLQSTIQKSDAGYKNASTTFYAAGSLVSITNNVYNITTNTLPAFCRVLGFPFSRSTRLLIPFADRSSIRHSDLVSNERQDRGMATRSERMERPLLGSRKCRSSWCRYVTNPLEARRAYADV